MNLPAIVSVFLLLQGVDASPKNQEQANSIQLQWSEKGSKNIVFECQSVRSEIMNGRLSIVVVSRDGKLFQFHGLPIPKGKTTTLKAANFRALLLNHGFSRKAALDDEDKEAKLTLTKLGEGDQSYRMAYQGKLQVDDQIILGQVSLSFDLPKKGEWMEPTK